MKEKSYLLFVGVFVFLIVFALTGFNYYQKTKLEDSISRLTVKNEEIKSSISEGEISETLRLFSAKEVLDDLDKNSIRWSKVIKEIVNTVPKDERGNMKLDVVAYSGAGSSDLTLNVSTVAGATSPFFDVADFIKAFDNSPKFLDNFVPSISSGITAEGREILTFSFSTRFKEESRLITR
jgi:Tfp pilus assembly protein PilN